MSPTRRHRAPRPLAACHGDAPEGVSSALWRELLVLGSWPAVAGRALGRLSQAVELDRSGVLTVSVGSKRWAREIEAHAPTLLEALHERSGQRIRRLRVRVEPESSQQPQTDPRPIVSSGPGGDRSSAALNSPSCGAVHARSAGPDLRPPGISGILSGVDVPPATLTRKDVPDGLEEVADRMAERRGRRDGDREIGIVTDPRNEAPGCSRDADTPADTLPVRLKGLQERYLLAAARAARSRRASSP